MFIKKVNGGICVLSSNNPFHLHASLSLFQSNKVPVVQHAHMHPLTPLITYSNEHFSPGTPPAHLSPEILDPKTGITHTRLTFLLTDCLLHHLIIQLCFQVFHGHLTPQSCPLTTPCPLEPWGRSLILWGGSFHSEFLNYIYIPIHSYLKIRVVVRMRGVTIQQH